MAVSGTSEGAEHELSRRDFLGATVMGAAGLALPRVNFSRRLRLVVS